MRCGMPDKSAKSKKTDHSFVKQYVFLMSFGKISCSVSKAFLFECQLNAMHAQSDRQ